MGTEETLKETYSQNIKKFNKIMSDYYSNSSKALTLQEIFECANEKDFFKNLSIEELQCLIDEMQEHSRLRYILKKIKDKKQKGVNELNELVEKAINESSNEEPNLVSSYLDENGLLQNTAKKLVKKPKKDR